MHRYGLAGSHQNAAEISTAFLQRSQIFMRLARIKGLGATPLVSGSLPLFFSARHRAKLALLLVFGLAAADHCAAQGFSLSGTVRDPNRKPLANVAVELETRSHGRRVTGTDETGRYVFTDLAPGDYEVSFELAGYATVVRIVSVKFDKDTKDDGKDPKGGDKGGDATLVPNPSRSKKR
jgi:hypothetical protein